MAKKTLLNISGDPKKPIVKEKIVLSSNKPQIDANFDLRDRLSELVGSGNALAPDNKAAIYGSLVAMLGTDKAQKVMNHAYIFNTRPEVQKLSLEDKLRSFYTIGSSDPEVMEIIGKTKNLGYGAVPGFRESISDINKQITGKNVNEVDISSVSPDVRKKVMLRVGK